VGAPESTHPAEPKRRPPSEPLGRRPVAEDERRHDPGGLVVIQRLGHGVPGPIADGEMACRIHLQIAGPVGIGVAGRDEQAAVRLLDEPDRDGDLAPGDPTPSREPDDLPPAGELFADLVRQRPFCCQDLPSVTTAGA